MNPDREEKKSETIEVRVPWSLKQRLMARARREDRPASEIVRDLIESYLRRPAPIPATQALETAMTTIRRHPRPAFAAILGAAGISALLAGAIPAGAAPDLQAAFERLDGDGDGVVTQEEFGATQRRVEIVREERSEPPADAPGEDIDTGPVLLPEAGSDGERIRVVRVVRRSSDDGAGDPGDLPDPVAEEFAAADADGDGALSFAEFEARILAMQSESFAALDTDGDGAISGEEAAVLNPPEATADDIGAAAAIMAQDADGDGLVSRAEYEGGA